MLTTEVASSVAVDVHATSESRHTKGSFMRRMLRTLSLTDRTSHAEAEHDIAEVGEPREHTAILAPLIKVSETLAYA
jgi:hypothetical protein